MIHVAVYVIKTKSETLTFVQGVNDKFGRSVPEMDIKYVKAMFRNMGFKIKNPRKREDYFSFQIVDTLSREL